MPFLPCLHFKGPCEIFIKINKNYVPAVLCSHSFAPRGCLEGGHGPVHFSLVGRDEEGTSRQLLAPWGVSASASDLQDRI